MENLLVQKTFHRIEYSVRIFYGIVLFVCKVLSTDDICIFQLQKCVQGIRLCALRLSFLLSLFVCMCLCIVWRRKFYSVSHVCQSSKMPFIVNSVVWQLGLVAFLCVPIQRYLPNDKPRMCGTFSLSLSLILSLLMSMQLPAKLFAT